MKKKEVNLFTFLEQIQSKERKHPYDKKLANAYMLTQYLSHDKNFVDKVNKINRFQFSLPDHVIYEYYMSVIPYRDKKNRFIKWTKKRKDDMFEKRVKKIQEVYPEMSKREARMVISFLQNKNVKEK